MVLVSQEEGIPHQRVAADHQPFEQGILLIGKIGAQNRRPGTAETPLFHHDHVAAGDTAVAHRLQGQLQTPAGATPLRKLGCQLDHLTTGFFGERRIQATSQPGGQAVEGGQGSRLGRGVDPSVGDFVFERCQKTFEEADIPL